MNQTKTIAPRIQSCSRRSMLERMCLGFGGVALHGMMPRRANAATTVATRSPLAPQVPHVPPRAKRVIFLFMHGGPSHVDLFDYKPRLYKEHDKPLPFKEREVQFANRANIMKPPWDFRRVGASGHWMSELWEHLPGVADDLCVIQSVCETNVAHGGACMKIHCGDEAFLRPSMGAWVSYGLGTENNNLPGFITICPTTLHGGVNNFGAAFLPSVHQGVPLGAPGYPNTLAKDARFNYMTNDSLSPRQQKLQLNLLRKLHEQNAAHSAINEALEARIQSFELAFRMQTEAPEVTDLSGESEITRKLYGMDDANTENFGQMCLLARRFAEKGVRFIQVSHAHSLPFNNEQWDQHSHLEKGHSINVRQIDKPITGLIRDLKRLGMLEDTLVLWGGEFGRTPTAQAGSGERGRDHHPDGFTVWMAGGGVQGGLRYGATDEYGYHAIEDRMTIHDLHATLLHILGLDHTRLTFEHAGRDYRLTDVYGEPATRILA
ncbi:MAG: DUF1501 domain-containing protein [Verrucomicrobia bacterium]|nr:DUF1501 domain-containing protein [Verrucomicrobiota bacterium]